MVKHTIFQGEETVKYFIDLVKDLNAGKFHPVYLFFGPEEYLRKEAAKKIQEKLLSGESKDFNLNIMDGQETPSAEIIHVAGMSPFFAEKRLVVVKNANFFARKKGDTGKTESLTEENSPPSPKK